MRNNYDAWISGLRRDETLARRNAPVVDWDAKRQMVKVNPIAQWTAAQVDEYIEEVFRVTKKRIFRTAIWKEARYRDATEFERWQRNDSRSRKKHDRDFTRVLTEKPHLK